MKLHILGSSSAGNGYILEGETSCLLIEAGCPLRDAKKALRFNLSKVDGLILSHAHGDHAGRVREYAAAGIDIYSSLECLKATGLLNLHQHRSNEITTERQYNIGEFAIIAFPLIHDVTNFGYLIRHKEMGLVSFLTDTCYSPFVFPGLNNIIVETNYSDNILEDRVNSGSLNPQLAERIKGSHMAESTMLEFLKANDTTKVNNIVIIHLSNGNSDAAQIVRNVTNDTGITPVIAAPGLSIEFNKTAF